MRRVNLDVMRFSALSAIILLLSMTSVAQVMEDFDHNDINVSEGNCWEYYNTVISKPPSSKSLNVGNDRPLADATLSGFAGSASLTSPYIEFSGASSISFSHAILDEDGAYSYLTVYIVDPAGNTVATLSSHTYRFFYTNWNGDPTDKIDEDISFNYTGWGRVVFYWGYLDTYTNGYLDEIEIDGLYAADDDNESNGYCPAEMQVYDTLCSATQAQSFEALYAQTTETYSWSFDGSSLGTIDYSITSNDSEIQLDLDSTSGDYILIAEESTSGHLTVFNIHVSPLPDLTFDIDSVCLEEAWTMDLNLTGTAPWEIQYSYTGSGTITVNTSDPNHSLSLPAEADTFDWIQITDGTGCTNTADFLPQVTVPYYPKPGPTGPIYH